VQRKQAIALADALEVQERGVASVAHEFRGALAVIQGAASTARQKRDRLDPASLDALLADIESQGHHIQSMLQGLTPAGAELAGGTAMRPRVDDVAETVRRAIESADRWRRNHNVRVEGGPLVCALDHERLQQIVRNLVENSFRHTRPGGTIVVGIRRLGVTVEVRVVDDGPGIPEGERVFEPFREGTGPAHRPHGLGLYLVRQIALAMGGTVELRSSPKGTDVAVRVPATRFGDSRDAPR
jgi:two-component system sensor histidine kinase KdpD